MNSSSIVVVEDVDVSYYLPRGVSGVTANIAKRADVGNFFDRFLREISVLKAVSLSLTEGQRVGLVGFNGAGKSTLLKVLAGALVPSRGKVEVNGQIASVLSLGGGVTGALSGRKNSIQKYYACRDPEYELSEFLEMVENECQLGDYFDMPVSTYSAGMKSRLDRAMLNLIRGEVYLFDEWVVLGDKGANSMSHSDALSDAKLVMLASHSESLLREWTDELIWMHDGEIKMFDSIDVVLSEYQGFVKSWKGIKG